MLDAQGSVVKRIAYDSFGNVLEDTNPALTLPFGFAGGLYDPDTALLRFGFRDYDPGTGRWTAKDPIGFAGGDTDLFQYVQSDPVNLIDPPGLIWVTTGHDYHGISNWARWYFNRVTIQIDKGMELNCPGADPNEYIGLKRDVIQKWEPDSENPCEDDRYPLGSKRRIPQEYKKYYNPGPDKVLIENPNDSFYFQWDPHVNSRTYDDYPAATYD